MKGLAILSFILLHYQLVKSQESKVVFTGLELRLLDGKLIPNQLSSVVLEMTLPVDQERSDETEEGPTKLWRSKVWASNYRMGGGEKISFLKQLFSRDQAGQPIEGDTSSLEFNDMLYLVDMTGRDCSVDYFICVRFQEWTEGPTVSFILEDGKEITRPTECVPIECSDDPCEGISCGIPNCPPGSFVDYEGPGCCPTCSPGGPILPTIDPCDLELVFCDTPNCGEGFVIDYDGPGCCPGCKPEEPPLPPTMDPCEGIFCDIPNCGEGFVIDYDGPGCCPGCKPEEPPLPITMDPCEGIQCGIPNCGEGFVIDYDGPGCCPGCKPEEPPLPPTIDPCEGIFCDIPNCGEGFVIDYDGPGCCPGCKPEEHPLPITMDPCEGIQCGIPNCGEGFVIDYDGPGCCPGCKPEEPPLPITMDPCEGIQCGIPNCPEGFVIDYESEGCCPGCKEEEVVEPPCPIQACILLYDPVCASDKKTYGNECMFKQAQCEDSTLIIVKKGECTEEEPMEPDCGDHGEGDKWIDRDGVNCMMMSCENGQLIMAMVTCMRPECDDPQYPPDGCCPVCPEEDEGTNGETDGGLNTGEVGEKDAMDLTTAANTETSMEAGEMINDGEEGGTDLTTPGTMVEPESRIDMETHICLQPIDVGPCRAALRRYAFNTETKQCELFLYGGCKGNENNFNSLASCEETCHSDPEDQCDGHEDGENWEAQPCEKCTCFEGSKLCTTPVCIPTGPCETELVQEGACCAYCPQVECDGYSEGDSWEPQACEMCSCVNGRKICASPSCSVVACNVELVSGEGACCPTCPEPSEPVVIVESCGTICISLYAPVCGSDGATYGNDCELENAKCKNPELTMTKEGRCDEEVDIEDACDGYEEGESWEPQQCETCTCLDGIKVCASPDCATPICDEPLEGEGACCPYCPIEIKVECDGYSEGDSWEPQACEMCSCVNGRKICASPSCSVVACNVELVSGEGACCPTCPEPSEPVVIVESCGTICISLYAPVCGSDGATYGNDCELENAKCKNPELTMTKEGRCDEEVDIEDACDGYEEGESWEPQPCELCTCSGGTKVCASPKCAPPLCDEPLEAEGLCCSICPIEITVECDGYSEGDSWEPQACEMCNCVNGRKICASPSCGVIPCNVELVSGEGACCPTCPEPSENLCDGYAEGHMWNPDPCTTCECTEGSKVCAVVDCPVLGCSSPKAVEGECCKQCVGPLRARTMSMRVMATPRVWRENRRLRPTFDFEIRPLSTSDNVTGTDLWKLSFWLDSSPNGDGTQMFYQEQVLSEEQAAQPLYSTEDLVFSGVRIPVGSPKVPCPEETVYYCASLQKGDRPSVRFFIQAPRRETSLMRCVKAPCLPNP